MQVPEEIKNTAEFKSNHQNLTKGDLVYFQDLYDFFPTFRPDGWSGKPYSNLLICELVWVKTLLQTGQSYWKISFLDRGDFVGGYLVELSCLVLVQRYAEINVLPPENNRQS